mmetsp:Transcript_26593/g.81798  ORF Transcript_26593/g.81798 Transcript_26593/m.81798 type:complete len:241 (-) Transcript_26593:13-735(-)
MAADDDDEPQCRICFCPEEDPRDPLIEPCLCKGSMALVHRSCLDACRVKGFDPSSLSRCGLCKHEYELEGVGRRAGPRTELAVIVFRYVGLRFLAFLGAAVVLGFVPRLVLGRDAAHELRVYEGAVVNHLSLGSLVTLMCTGGYAVVAFISPLNLARTFGGRGWTSGKRKDDSLQAVVIILIVVGVCYVLYHLVTAIYHLARTGVPVAIGNVQNANRTVRADIAKKYPVVDRRKTRRKSE